MSCVNVLFSLLILPFKNSMGPLSLVILTFKFVTFWFFFTSSIKAIVEEVTFIGDTRVFVFSYSLSVVIMEVPIVEEAIWWKVNALSFCLAMLKMSNIEGSVCFVHPAISMRIFTILNRKAPNLIELSFIDLFAELANFQFSFELIFKKLCIGYRLLSLSNLSLIIGCKMGISTGFSSTTSIVIGGSGIGISNISSGSMCGNAYFRLFNPFNWCLGASFL